MSKQTMFMRTTSRYPVIKEQAKYVERQALESLGFEYAKINHKVEVMYRVNRGIQRDIFITEDELLEGDEIIYIEKTYSLDYEGDDDQP